MPFDGSGGAVSVGRPAYPPNEGEIILAGYFVAIIDDILEMLSNCLTADGQSVVVMDLAMAGHRLTGLASAIAAGQALVYGQSNASLTSLSVGTVKGAVTFEVAPQAPTGAAGTGGLSLATQQYADTVAQQAALATVPNSTAGHEALAILTYIGA